MQHRTIATQGGTVHYWISRNENASDCIVFTHGVTADHTMFEKQIPCFSGKYTLLVEMSMGGYPSQHFAAMYPGMVKGFVALDTTPLGLKYYSKLDLWWLKRAAPMAKCFTTSLLRKSMAWSVSESRYSYQKMLSMLKPLSKAEIIQQMQIAYEYFIAENKDVDFPFPVLILAGEKDSTGKVKAYCKEWAKQTGYPLHFIKQAKHFANGDNPEQVNKEIENFITRTARQEKKIYAASGT